ncbi:MAG: tRNA (guanosine(37)-N1)-methyltransferase TrmD [Dehalococcoidia bacterium]
MRIDVLTLFPRFFDGPLDQSIVKRAREAGVLRIEVHDIRDWAEGRHRVCDDYPFGGGPGMVMKPEPVFAALEAVTAMDAARGPVVLLTPQGEVLTQSLVRDLALEPRLTLLCGHYEGVDERVVEHAVTHEVSVGDYILSGGEPAALMVLDAVARLVPGVVGSDASLVEESHGEGLLEYPHYTRPADFRGWRVPDILLSGHHAEIARWRRQQRLLRTAHRRPDLLERAEISDAERAWLEERLRE